MCGRFTLYSSTEELAVYFSFDNSEDSAPRYNICPSQTIPCIIQDETGKRVIKLFRWGLIPSWAKNPKIGNRLINARSETVATKPSFRSAFKYRRCLIPTNGFFEWKRIGKSKHPIFIRMCDGKPFAFAGIWESWTNPEGQTIKSCAILTTSANELVEDIHNRMPVILHPEDYDLWMNPEAALEALQSLLKPFPSELMESYPVSNSVNNPRCNAPECIFSIKMSVD